MLPFRTRRLAGVAAVVLDAIVLRVGWVPPTQLLTHLAHPRSWVDTVGSDAATIELARAGLCLVGAWLGVAFLAVLASRLPGTIGGVADRVAGRAVPAILHRAIAAALGASVVLVPVAAGASTNAAHSGATAATSTMTATSASDGGPAAPMSGPGATQLSGGWPWPTSPPTTAPTSTSASGTPVKPIPWPRSANPVAPAPSTPRSTSGSDVVVKAGDCLWAIAAHRLGPDASAQRIKSETQRWYEANAATVGNDPSLIHPGQLLHQPTEKGR